jgi:hypothetical protein
MAYRSSSLHGSVARHIAVALAAFALPAGADVYETRTESLRVGQTQQSVATNGVARKHDFGATGGFVDKGSGSPRLATILTASGPGKNTLLSGGEITNAGVPSRAFWSPAGAVMRQLAGEGDPARPCRAQAASFQLAPDEPLRWQLRFRLGDSGAGLPWRLTPTGSDPILLWQVKAPDLQPSLVLVADTDPDDPMRVMLFFTQKTGNAGKPIRIGSAKGLRTEEFIDVRIEAVLDERELANGGRGRWHAWVNDRLVVDRVGPTLSREATAPHQWLFGIYRYASTCPSDTPRATLWERALLERMGGGS